MCAQRITEQSKTQVFIRQIAQQRVLLEESRQQIASGARVINPSDDAARVGTISNLSNALERFDRHRQRIGFATSLLNQQENLLNETANLLVRAKELATSGLNESNSAESRRAIAQEAWGLRDAVIAIANFRTQGMFLFGGKVDDSPPFIEDTYLVPADPNDPASKRFAFDAQFGRDEVRNIAVNDSISIQVTTPGQPVFERAIFALERLARALDGYRTEPPDLTMAPDGTGTAYTFPADYDEQTETMNDLLALIDGAREDDIMAERTDIGGRLAQVVQAETILEGVVIDTQASRSAFQDVDLIEVVSLFESRTQGLEATLRVSAQLNSLSILDFL